MYKTPPLPPCLNALLQGEEQGKNHANAVLECILPICPAISNLVCTLGWLLAAIKLMKTSPEIECDDLNDLYKTGSMVPIRDHTVLQPLRCMLGRATCGTKYVAITEAEIMQCGNCGII
jgi:hypothetical protein